MPTAKPNHPARKREPRQGGVLKHAGAPGRIKQPASKTVVEFRKSGHAISLRLEGAAAYCAGIAGAGAGLAYLTHLFL